MYFLNAKAILVKGHWYYNLTHKRGYSVVHTLTNAITTKLNIIVGLKFEFTYQDTAVQLAGHNAKWTPLIWKTWLGVFIEWNINFHMLFYSFI